MAKIKVSNHINTSRSRRKIDTWTYFKIHYDLLGANLDFRIPYYTVELNIKICTGLFCIVLKLPSILNFFSASRAG
jgi:hypothetical protein